jgi:hypothetical protein
MLEDKIKESLDQLINRTIISLHTIMFPLRIGKAHFQIKNESDYALGLAHGMIIAGFVSDFNAYNNREPNEEEMVEMSTVIFKRTDEIREAISKGG